MAEKNRLSLKLRVEFDSATGELNIYRIAGASSEYNLFSGALEAESEHARIFYKDNKEKPTGTLSGPLYLAFCQVFSNIRTEKPVGSELPASVKALRITPTIQMSEDNKIKKIGEGREQYGIKTGVYEVGGKRFEAINDAQIPSVLRNHGLNTANQTPDSLFKEFVKIGNFEIYRYSDYRILVVRKNFEEELKRVVILMNRSEL